MRRYYRDAEFRDSVLDLSHGRRADKLGLRSRKVALSYLADRDNWTCGICHRRVRPGQESIDHIVPLSKGGSHELSNVQLAHRRCNYQKGNRGHGDQLLLVG